MSIVDWFKPKWQRRDPAKRRQAIAAGLDIRVLRELAEHDNDESVRGAAMDTLQTDDLKVIVAQSGYHYTGALSIGADEAHRRLASRDSKAFADALDHFYDNACRYRSGFYGPPALLVASGAILLAEHGQFKPAEDVIRHVLLHEKTRPRADDALSLAKALCDRLLRPDQMDFLLEVAGCFRAGLDWDDRKASVHHIYAHVANRCDESLVPKIVDLAFRPRDAGYMGPSRISEAAMAALRSVNHRRLDLAIGPVLAATDPAAALATASVWTARLARHVLRWDPGGKGSRRPDDPGPEIVPALRVLGEHGQPDDEPLVENFALAANAAVRKAATMALEALRLRRGEPASDAGDDRGEAAAARARRNLEKHAVSRRLLSTLGLYGSASDLQTLGQYLEWTTGTGGFDIPYLHLRKDRSLVRAACRAIAIMGRRLPLDQVSAEIARLNETQRRVAAVLLGLSSAKDVLVESCVEHAAEAWFVLDVCPSTFSTTDLDRMIQASRTVTKTVPGHFLRSYRAGSGEREDVRWLGPSTEVVQRGHAGLFEAAKTVRNSRLR